MASWQACIDPAANRACPASITPERARCRRTKYAIPAPATQKETCTVPAQAVLTDFNRRSAHHQVLDRREP